MTPVILTLVPSGRAVESRFHQVTMGWTNHRRPLAILWLIILSVNQGAAGSNQSLFYSAVYFDTEVPPGDARKFCRSFGHDADLVMMKTTAQVQAVRELMEVAELPCENSSAWKELRCLPTIGLILSKKKLREGTLVRWVDGSGFVAAAVGMDGNRQDPTRKCGPMWAICSCTVLNRRMTLMQVPCDGSFSTPFRISCQATSSDAYERMINNASALCGLFVLDSEGPTNWTASCMPPPPLPDSSLSTDSHEISPESSTIQSTTVTISTTSPTPTTAVEVQAEFSPYPTTGKALSSRAPDLSILPAIATTSQEPGAILQATVATADPTPSTTAASIVIPQTTAQMKESEGDSSLTSLAKKIGMAVGGVGVLAMIVVFYYSIWNMLADNYANWRFDRDHLERTADDASILLAIGKFLFIRSIILVSLCEIVEANRKEDRRRKAEGLTAIFLAQRNISSDLYKIKCPMKVILKAINQSEAATVDEYEKAINDALRMKLEVVIVKGVIKYAAAGGD